jgi:steroid 5-alpha reductase family enzyme
MSFIEVLTIGGIATLVYLTIGWALSLVRRDAGLMDVMWGLGFALLAVLYFALTDGYIGRKILVLTLVSIWGLRLTLSTLRRNVNAPEDFRYRELREKDGPRFWITSFFRPFLLHGSAIRGVSVPVLVAMYCDTPQSLHNLGFARCLAMGDRVLL